MTNNGYEALIKSATVHFYANEYDEAVKDYTKAIDLDRDNPQAYKLRAYVYDAKKDYAKAITAYEEAIRHAPGDPMLKVQLATVYGKRGCEYLIVEDYSMSLHCFRKALELDPGDRLGNNDKFQEALMFAQTKMLS